MLWLLDLGIEWVVWLKSGENIFFLEYRLLRFFVMYCKDSRRSWWVGNMCVRTLISYRSLSLVLVSFLHHYLKVLMIFTWLCIIFPYPWLLCIERSCVGRSGLIMSLWEFFLFSFGKSLWSIWFGLVSQVDNWFLVLLLLSYSNRKFIVLCGRFHGGMHILRVSIIS